MKRLGSSAVQYIVLHPLFSTKAFVILFKNFEEQIEDFFNVTIDSLVRKLVHPA